MIGVHWSIKYCSSRSVRREMLRFVVVVLCALGPVFGVVAADEKSTDKKSAERPDRSSSRRRGFDRRGAHRWDRARSDSRKGSEGRSHCRRHGRHEEGQTCRKCRQHWDALDPQKRKSIRKLHDRLSKLDSQKRGELRKWLHQADAEDVRRAVKNLQKLSDLPPDQRQREIRKFHSHLADERRWRLLRSRIPEKRRREIEREIEKVPAQERGRKIRAVCDRYINEVLSDESHRQRREAMIETLSPTLQTRIRGMEPLEQVRFLLGYQSKRLFEKVFDDLETRKAFLRVSPPELRGLVDVTAAAARPAFFSEASWKRWNRLKREERERLVRYVYRYERCKHRRGGRPQSKDRSGASSWRSDRIRSRVRPESPLEEKG